MRTLLLGIDIGTSACKVAAFHLDGRVEATETAEYAIYYPQEGWAEQNPKEWWEAVCAATKNLLQKSAIASTEVVAVGIDGQSWSAIPITNTGEVLCNTPIWMDTRAREICERIRNRIGEDNIFKISGNPLQPSYSLPKVLWYKEQCPDVYRRTDKILQSNSYIAYCLTGEMTQDYSQGYGYSCYDIRSGKWDLDLCREVGMNPDLLPEIVPCHEIVGKVTKKAARQTGLTEGTPVVAGGLDAACGTLGAGVIHNGETQEQGGQAGGMSICTGSCYADPRLILSNHVISGKWLLQGGTVGGGGIVRWFESQFGEHEREIAARNSTTSFQEMDVLAENVLPGSEGVIFLPYMAGERSPIWNPSAKGVYYGLDFSKTRAHMIRASMEGVAFSLQHNLMIAQMAGAKTERLRAMGGAANSRIWTQIKSDITGKPIDVPASDTATTLGAAILAGIGTGVYSDAETAVRKTVQVQRTQLPNPENTEIYKQVFAKYLSLYEQLEPLMK